MHIYMMYKSDVCTSLEFGPLGCMGRPDDRKVTRGRCGQCEIIWMNTLLS